MNENIFQKKPAKTAEPFSKPPVNDQPKTDDVLAKTQQALGYVEISHGVQTVNYPVAGKTVAYVREALASLLNVPQDAQARINGTEVKDEQNTIIEKNTKIEFIKSAGSKGALNSLNAI